MQKLKSVCLFLLLCIVLSSVCSCTTEDTNQDNEGITVVATLFPQYDFARSILGEKGRAVLLLTPGADSHNFELKPSDIRTINDSDIFVYTGPGMEIWVDSIISSINDKVNIVNLAECVSVNNTHAHDNEDHNHDHSDTDPHIWTNLKYAKKMLYSIYDSICEADSENTDYYNANYEACLAELQHLDNEIEEIASESKNSCLYFSGKFAFYHFAEEYGFSYEAPFNSCSDVQIESLSAINKLIKELKDNNVKYIFYEELSNNSILKTIIDETGVTPLLLHSAHNVSKVELESGVSYVSIMENNVLNLRKALIDG